MLMLIVWQELIQNAEDAGAQRIVFMLDHTSYSHREATLHDAGLASYQVLCYAHFAVTNTCAI